MKLKIVLFYIDKRKDNSLTPITWNEGRLTSLRRCAQHAAHERHSPVYRWNPKPFFTKKEKNWGQVLKIVYKVCNFWFSSEKITFQNSLQKKAKIMSQVGVQKFGAPVFFTAAAVHGSLKYSEKRG